MVGIHVYYDKIKGIGIGIAMNNERLDWINSIVFDKNNELSEIDNKEMEGNK